MKKANKLLLLVFLSYASPSISFDHTPFNKLKVENISLFLEGFKKICVSKKLPKNISTHPSFPNFGKKQSWENICEKMINKKKIDKNFLKNNFHLKQLSKDNGKLTGYYEPEIRVSKVKTREYNIPILKFNKKFLKVKRKQIEKNYQNKDVLLWTNDIIDLFFLQIQGSGIGVFENKEKVKIIYNGNNDKKYTSIGSFLIKENLIEKRNVNLFTIKNFLRNNPDKINYILNQNERYIFFKIANKSLKNPLGALGMELIPFISIAIDKKYYPLGIPFVLYEKEEKSYKIVLGMDTGSAIKGKNRADLFTGSGEKAESVAGMMKNKLILYSLVPY